MDAVRTGVARRDHVGIRSPHVDHAAPSPAPRVQHSRAAAEPGRREDLGDRHPRPRHLLQLVFKGRGPFLEAHAKTALNFHLTTLIAYVAGTILSFVLVGFIVFLVVPILVIVFAIIASVRASAGEYYTYPLSIPFFK
jgi:uncharacterized Tic20 family protein